ncbi:MAG: hypothetical protein V2I33_18265 [Kangiellaceae bacterium]|jgi:hypothetical protein|nr:hypothetical protein [Kangiellaceae bacterium]
MDKFAKPFEEEQDTGSGIDRPSESCACGEPACVRLAVVSKNPRDPAECRPFSEVGFCKHTPSGAVIWSSAVMKSGWEFHRWLQLCPDCFYNTPKAEPSRYSGNVARMAWTWFLAKVSQGGDIPLFQYRLENTDDEQERRYIEIVNHEAKRLHQPEAIPDEYKLQEVWA